MQEEIGLWSPDVFRLDDISAGNSLLCAAYSIFKTRQFSCLFKISPPIFINFILAIQVLYMYSTGLIIVPSTVACVPVAIRL